MGETNKTSRREFLRFGAIAAGGAALLSWRNLAYGQGGPKEQKAQESWKAVGPVEDLMREHGLLRRILLIYEEGIRRIRRKIDIPTGTLNNAADIIRRFINEYHEQLEEKYVFPAFEKAGKEADLVKVLLRQHRAGEAATETILQLTGAAVFSLPGNRNQLTVAMGKFIRMYRPHAAREDTVLFPAFRDVVTCKQYHELGEKFEDQEEKLFGVRGFERMVARVAGIEKSLGLYNLNQFTP